MTQQIHIQTKFEEFRAHLTKINLKTQAHTLLKERPLAKIATMPSPIPNFKTLLIKDYLGKTRFWDYIPRPGQEIGQSTAWAPHKIACYLEKACPTKLTPTPIACRLHTKFGCHRYSTLIQEYCHDSPLLETYYNTLQTEAPKKELALHLGQQLAKLHKHHVFHGDAHVNNVIIHQKTPLFIDLDRALHLKGLFRLVALLFQISDINNIARSFKKRSHAYKSRLFYIGYAQEMGWSKRKRYWFRRILNPRFF